MGSEYDPYEKAFDCGEYLEDAIMERLYGTTMTEHKHPAKIKPKNCKIGERYFLPGGTKPFTLLDFTEDSSGHRIIIKYDSLDYPVTNYAQSLHKAIPTGYIGTNWTQEKENDMNTLYEFDNNGKQTFGTKIAVNSSGLWVMEVKGTGDVVTVDKDKVEEVIPHSIGVKFLTGDTVYHYTAPKGKFDKGFYLFDNHMGTSLVEIVALDTKSKKATKEFTPTLKFVTEAIDSSSDT